MFLTTLPRRNSLYRIDVGKYHDFGLILESLRNSIQLSKSRHDNLAQVDVHVLISNQVCINFVSI